MNEYSLTYCRLTRDLASFSAIEHPDGSDSSWELHSWRVSPDSPDHVIVMWQRSVDGRPTMPHDMAGQADLEKHRR